MNNTSKALDRSFRNKNMLRKRRKQPSESIDNNRNENGRNGTTLQLFSNCAGSTNKSFNSKIVCHKKYNSNISQARKVNVSHTEIAAKVTSRAAKLQKAPDSAISQQNIKLIEQKQNITTCLTSRRTSGILRPNTSLGRNHSLFDNSKKYNYSYIQTKRPNEHLMSQPSWSEKGNIEISVTEPWIDTNDEAIEKSTREVNGSIQGIPKLTKNYSLNTIFERKKNMSKDFIKNNIKNVSKLSTKGKDQTCLSVGIDFNI